MEIGNDCRLGCGGHSIILGHHPAAPAGDYKNRRFDMMHVTGDCQRMCVANASLSMPDHSGRFYVRLAHIGAGRYEGGPVHQSRLRPLPDRTGTRARHAVELSESTIEAEE
jgi:hypothetical protein